MSSTRTIPQLDKLITANRRALLRRHPVANQLSAADWQAAWDAEPVLKAVEDALFRERGDAHLEQTRRDYENAVRAARSIRAPKAPRCTACGKKLAA